MSQNTTPASSTLCQVASSASPEYFRVILKSYKAELAPYEEGELLTEEEMIRPLILLDLIKETEGKLSEAIAAEEIAATKAARKAVEVEERKEKAKNDFEQMRLVAATALAQKGEGVVAPALRGEGHPAWGKAVLKAFLARFPEGRRSTYHDIVIGAIADAEAAIAREAEEMAEAEKIRAEAKRRYEKNRADRVERNRRGKKK